MVKTATCDELFNGHCSHWGLSETAHALMHAQQRRIEEVVAVDKRLGLFNSGTSSSSVAHDGPRLEALLADEGYVLVPVTVDAADLGQAFADGHRNLRVSMPPRPPRGREVS